MRGPRAWLTRCISIRVAATQRTATFCSYGRESLDDCARWRFVDPDRKEESNEVQPLQYLHFGGGLRGASSASRTVLSYALAPALVAAALLLSLRLQPFVPHGFVYLFLAAVVASSWFGSRGSGLLAVLLALLTVDYFFIPPFHTFAINEEEWAYFLPFLLSGLAAAWMSSTRKLVEEALTERARLAALSGDIGAALTRAGTLRQGLQECTETLVRHLDAACGRIWTLNETTQVLELEASAGICTRIDGAHARVPVGKFKIGKIAQECKPQYSNGVPTEDWLSDPECTAEQGVVACAGYPLVLEGRSIGVIAVFARQPLSEAVIRDLASVAGRAAQFVKRKLSDEALRVSEEQFRQLAENIHEVFFIGEPAPARLIYLSPAYEEIWGRPRQEAYERPDAWIDTIHSEDRERASSLFTRAYQGERANAEYRVVRPDRSIRFIRARAFPVLNAEGRFCRLVGIAEDVTERKRAESELRESKEMFEHLFEAAPDAIVATDGRGNITRVNAVVEKQFGYDRGELLGKSVEMLVPERLRDAHTKQREGYLEEPRRRPMGRGLDLFGKRKDGSEFPVDVMLSPVETAGSRLVLSVVRDITERKQAQEAFERLSKQNELILNSAGEGIFRIDAEGRTTFVNPSAAGMVRWKPEEMIGKAHHALLHHTKADGTPYPAEECPINAPLRDGQIHRADSEIFWRKDGTRFPIEFASAPIREHGKIEGAVILFSDITKRKEAEQQILSALQMKSDFVSFATHQLRTPLTGIKWLLELVAQAELQEETRSLVGDARMSADRLIRLVNDLLDASKLEAGKLAIVPQETDLRELTLSVLKDLEPQIQLQGDELSLHGDAKVPLVRVDPQLFRQVILNLISNAIKYTPPKGKIDIEVAGHNGHVRWTIRDNGIGIPKSSQARLFEKFFRAENAYKMETEGTGLGLYIVQMVVESSHGRLWCESEEGSGSTFAFELPLGGVH
jgi:PAS domain S-box-containing protein